MVVHSLLRINPLNPIIAALGEGGGCIPLGKAPLNAITRTLQIWIHAYRAI